MEIESCDPVEIAKEFKEEAGKITCENSLSIISCAQIN